MLTMMLHAHVSLFDGVGSQRRSNQPSRARELRAVGAPQLLLDRWTGGKLRRRSCPTPHYIQICWVLRRRHHIRRRMRGRASASRVRRLTTAAAMLAVGRGWPATAILQSLGAGWVTAGTRSAAATTAARHAGAMATNRSGPALHPTTVRICASRSHVGRRQHHRQRRRPYICGVSSTTR